MNRILKKTLCVVLTVLMLLPTLAGCANTPKEIDWAVYDDSQDAPFTAKDIFDDSMWVSGIVISKGETLYSIEAGGENAPGRAFVLKGEYGKCYEVKFQSAPETLRAAKVNQDPRTLEIGSKIQYAEEDSLFFFMFAPDETRSFMYTCREQDEYLVVYIGTQDVEVWIGERTIIQDTDTEDSWFKPESVGGISKKGTLGNYTWTSQQVYDNLYEPLREKNPGYITRTSLGMDQSGEYEMFGYIFAPKEYQATLFITGGMHANEETAYYSLAKLMQLICDAQPEDTLLYTLRHKVRFIVVPMINVWGISQNHEGQGVPRTRIRSNSQDVDLNRDFGELTQQESKNVMAFFETYAKEVDIHLDFHTASGGEYSMWYNFINYSENSVVNYKTVNHMYHRYLEEGCAVKETDLTHVPGSYVKTSKYIEGRIWNEYQVPTITVEQVVNDRFPVRYSDEAMTLAVENFGNFVIQNALFYLQKNAQQ